MPLTHIFASLGIHLNHLVCSSTSLPNAHPDAALSICRVHNIKFLHAWCAWNWAFWERRGVEGVRGVGGGKNAMCGIDQFTSFYDSWRVSSISNQRGRIPTPLRCVKFQLFCPWLAAYHRTLSPSRNLAFCMTPFTYSMSLREFNYCLH